MYQDGFFYSYFCQMFCANSFQMKRLSLLLLFFTLSLQAQFQVNGIIKDFETKKALPFATIKTENGFSTISDVDGKFNFLLASQPERLTVSYIGYESKTISAFEIKPYSTLYLLPKINALKEVTISNVNPAYVIIAKVIPQNYCNLKDNVNQNQMAQRVHNH